MAKTRIGVDWKTAAAEEIWERALYYARLFIAKEREGMPFDQTLSISDRAKHEVEEIIRTKIPARPPSVDGPVAVLPGKER